MRSTFIKHGALLIFFCLFSVTAMAAEQEQSEPSSPTADSDVSTTVSTPPGAQPSQVQDEQTPAATDATEKAVEQKPRSVNAIIITGNHLVPTEAILDRIPYKIGELFDRNKTRSLIRNLYLELKRFKNITVFGENVGDDKITIHVNLEEKYPLQEVVFKNNKQLSEKEIREKINFSEVPAIDQQDLAKYILALQKLYREKGFHHVDISTTFEVNEHNKAIVTFIFKEHKQAVVKHITFKGNNNISGKKLRGVLFSKEDWLLSFMDKSGTYQQDRIDADKHMIEQCYQNNGYINAKVVDTQTTIDPISQYVTVTHEIQEGKKYIVNSVKAPGNDILKDEFLESVLPIKPGDIYSREKIVDSIKTLEFIWGDMGYVYAHIEPSIIPDDEKGVVNITFIADPGNQVFLRRLTILGNHKTRDKVIRRKISMDEGFLLTNRQMEASKTRIAGLGYFDQRDGVNWKMSRLSNDSADLDLIVKEVKTGNAHLQLSFGGNARSIQSNSTGVALEGVIADTNLFGSGVRFNLTGRLGNDEKTLLFNITDPWLFDRPIYGAIDAYHKRAGYDELKLTLPVNEKYTGGLGTLGFVTASTHSILNDTFFRCSLGIDDIRYEGQGGPKAVIRGLPTTKDNLIANASYDLILSKMFNPGVFSTFILNIGKDAKNHPMHPSMGYSWLARSIFAVPVLTGCIGFYKFDMDAHWFTPLIGDFDLILHLHGYLGAIARIHNKFVPYRELFHIGGQASVRGFLYGQIGPQFSVVSNGQTIQDSIGGNKTFFVNMELIFPIMQDFSFKGIAFYDGGAGWDNPYTSDIPPAFLANNSFNYRHAVGVGIRLLNPVPVKIDWGFKLDPRRNETGSEVHFSMSYDW